MRHLGFSDDDRRGLRSVAAAHFGNGPLQQIVRLACASILAIVPKIGLPSSRANRCASCRSSAVSALLVVSINVSSSTSLVLDQVHATRIRH